MALARLTRRPGGSEVGRRRTDRDGSAAAVLVLDATGTPIKRYRLVKPIPKHLEISTADSVLTEKLVITYETAELE